MHETFRTLVNWAVLYKRKTTQVYWGSGSTTLEWILMGQSTWAWHSTFSSQMMCRSFTPAIRSSTEVRAPLSEEVLAQTSCRVKDWEAAPASSDPKWTAAESEAPDPKTVASVELTSSTRLSNLSMWDTSTWQLNSSNVWNQRAGRGRDWREQGLHRQVMMTSTTSMVCLIKVMSRMRPMSSTLSTHRVSLTCWRFFSGQTKGSSLVSLTRTGTSTSSILNSVSDYWCS